MLRIDLITGFLGAGKTTFLTEYAKYLISRGMRIGILEYDYGAVNIDMVLLGKLRSANCELEMIDASCDREGIIRRLRAKLIAMAMSGYDRVILEPSGVFDMDMFFDLLRDEPLDEWYEIGSVITVVNAKLRGLLDAESAYILASQAAGAGTILLSRTQLATKAEIEATKQMLEDAAKNISCRKFKPVYVDKPWNEFTDADYENIMQSGYVIDDYIKTIAGEKSGFTTLIFFNCNLQLDELKDKISRAFKDERFGRVERIKGFAKADGVNYLVNSTKYEETVEPVGTGQSIIIVIGSKMNKEEIESLFAK